MPRVQDPFHDADRAQLEERGIALEEARRQLELLNGPPRYVPLLRCCRVGDGILAIDPARHEALLDLHGRAAREGRFRKFVPASGAATRMFRDLERIRGGREDLPADAANGFLEGLDTFAFREELREELTRRGEDLDALRAAGAVRPILDALLGPDGLDYASLPKGLLPFHDSKEGPRTPFEEHLVEAAGFVKDRGRTARLHFTVSPEHRDGFRSLLRRVGPAWQARLDVRFDVEFSEQHPSTDTIAVDPSGRPFRDDDGRLVFRPSGHGALLRNLSDLQGDLVYVKNIDNVVPDGRKGPTLLWKRILGGFLVELQDRVHRAVRALEDSGPDAETIALARELLHRVPPAGVDSRRWLLDELDRPIRVCGVVRNAGEPGGGPFWIGRRPGTGPLQIVEGAQVDPDDPTQIDVFRSATHFNPVDLVCGLRGADGEPFDLASFVDPSAVIVTEKSFLGRSLRALERPGLWNGGMALWHTVFVEVPGDTFAPVKTVHDLLREEHRGV